MTGEIREEHLPHTGLIHPDFEALVHAIIERLPTDDLKNLRMDFHGRLRMTQTQPDDATLIEDLWDFFYDWCFFERKLPEAGNYLSDDDRARWERVRDTSVRSLFSITRANDSGLKLKDLFEGKTYTIPKGKPSDFLGLSRGDLVEARILSANDPKQNFSFVRTPSYHPGLVHGYLKLKIKQFKKSKDVESYQGWLWLLVGMYLKHRIYHQMPIEKIYDDNSRI